MKKLLLGALTLAVITFASSNSVTAIGEHEIHLHNHAEVANQANRMVNWQCKNCGQTAWLQQGTLPASYGCDGDFSKRHIWEKLD